MTPTPIQVLAETKFLRLIQDRHWTYVQRPNVTGAIAILAITNDQEIVLVDQHRIPVAGRVIELPAGLVGDLDDAKEESIELAAQRELIEETGYQASEISILVDGVSSAGLTDERVHLVLAKDIQKVGPGGGDGTEDILVHLVPLSHVDDWLLAQRAAGKDIDFKVFAGLHFAKRLSITGS